MTFFKTETANTASDKTQLDFNDFSGLNINFADFLGHKHRSMTKKYAIGKHLCRDIERELVRIHAYQTIGKIEKCIMEDKYFRFDFVIPEAYDPKQHYQHLVKQFPRISNHTRFESSEANFCETVFLQDCHYTANVYSILHKFSCKKRSEYLEAATVTRDITATFEVQDRYDLYTQNIIFCINFLLYSMKDQTTKGILMYPSKVIISTRGDYRIQLYYRNKLAEVEDLHEYSDFKTFLEQSLSKQNDYLITEAILNDYIALKVDELGHAKSEVTKAVYNAINIVAKFQSLYSAFSFYQLKLFSDNIKNYKLFEISERDKYCLRTLGFSADNTDPFYKEFFVNSNLTYFDIDYGIVPETNFANQIGKLKGYFCELYYFCYKACEIYDYHAMGVTEASKNNSFEKYINSLKILKHLDTHKRILTAYDYYRRALNAYLKELKETTFEAMYSYNVKTLKTGDLQVVDPIETQKLKSGRPYLNFNNISGYKSDYLLQDCQNSLYDEHAKIETTISHTQDNFRKNIRNVVLSLRVEYMEVLKKLDVEYAIEKTSDTEETESPTLDERQGTLHKQNLYTETINALIQICNKTLLVAREIPDEFAQLHELLNIID